MVAEGLGGSDPPTRATLSPANPSVRQTGERWMGCQRAFSGGCR